MTVLVKPPSLLTSAQENRAGRLPRPGRGHCNRERGQAWSGFTNVSDEITGAKKLLMRRNAAASSSGAGTLGVADHGC